MINKSKNIKSKLDNEEKINLDQNAINNALDMCSKGECSIDVLIDIFSSANTKVFYDTAFTSKLFERIFYIMRYKSTEDDVKKFVKLYVDIYKKLENNSLKEKFNEDLTFFLQTLGQNDNFDRTEVLDNSIVFNHEKIDCYTDILITSFEILNCDSINRLISNIEDKISIAAILANSNLPPSTLDKLLTELLTEKTTSSIDINDIIYLTNYKESSNYKKIKDRLINYILDTNRGIIYLSINNMSESQIKRALKLLSNNYQTFFIFIGNNLNNINNDFIELVYNCVKEKNDSKFTTMFYRFLKENKIFASSIFDETITKVHKLVDNK